MRRPVNKDFRGTEDGRPSLDKCSCARLCPASLAFRHMSYSLSSLKGFTLWDLARIFDPEPFKIPLYSRGPKCHVG